MTVSDLIAELQRMPPSLPVKMLMTDIIMIDVMIDEQGEYSISLSEEDAETVGYVQHAGGYVLMKG